MSGKIKICRVGEFIKFTEIGVLDVDRSIRIVRKLAVSANIHKDHNILLDLRDSVWHASTGDLILISLEFASQKEVFQNKIAVLAPNTKKQLEIAKQFKLCMDVQGILLRHFINYEKAIEWLSN